MMIVMRYMHTHPNRTYSRGSSAKVRRNPDESDRPPWCLFLIVIVISDFVHRPQRHDV